MTLRRLTGIYRFPDFAGSDRAVELHANDSSWGVFHA